MSSLVYFNTPCVCMDLFCVLMQASLIAKIDNNCGQRMTAIVHLILMALSAVVMVIFLFPHSPAITAAVNILDALANIIGEDCKELQEVSMVWFYELVV